MKTTLSTLILGLVLLGSLHAQPPVASNALLVKHQLQYYSPRLFFCVNANSCYQEIPMLRKIVNHILEAKLPVNMIFVMKQIRRPEVPSFMQRYFGAPALPGNRVIIDEELFDLLTGSSNYTGLYYLDDLGKMQEIRLINTSYNDAVQRVDGYVSGPGNASVTTLEEKNNYIDHNVQFLYTPDGPVALNTTQELISIFTNDGKLVREEKIPVRYDTLLLRNIFNGDLAAYRESRSLQRVLPKVGLTPSSYHSLVTGGDKTYLEFWYKYAVKDTTPAKDPLDTNMSVYGFRAIVQYSVTGGAWRTVFLPSADTHPEEGYIFDGLVYGCGDTVYARLMNTADNTGDSYGVYDLSGDLVRFRRFLPLPSLQYERGETPEWIFRTVRERPVAIEVHKAVWCDLRSGASFRLPVPVTTELKIKDVAYCTETGQYHLLFYDGNYYVVQTHADIGQPAVNTHFFNPIFFNHARYMLAGDRLLIFSIGTDQVLYYQRKL